MSTTGNYNKELDVFRARLQYARKAISDLSKAFDELPEDLKKAVVQKLD